jgi:GntR family transcriptional regulator
VSEEPATIAGRLASSLDPGLGTPLSRQIVEWVWLEVVSGGLETGERLPTARQLAVDLGVTPRVVERAYAELERLGVVSHRPGEGAFVSVTPPPEQERERHTRFAELCRDVLARAEALGFTVTDMMDALAELRDARHENRAVEDELP